MLIAITNASTLCADADIATIASAIVLQMVDVAQVWDREMPSVSFSPLADFPQAVYDVGIVVLDDADQAGALGYHSVTPWGQPYARVFARDSIAALAGFDPASLSGPQTSAEVLTAVAPVVSHELIEAFLDEFADAWADNGQGTEIAWEGCDPCESNVYTVTLPDGTVVTLSDWVTPFYFDAQATGEFDWLGQVPGPFGLATGGYQVQMTEGTVSSVFGRSMPAWRKAQHKAAERDAAKGNDTAHMASRTGKRFLTSHRAAAKPTVPPGTTDLPPGTPPQPSEPPTATVAQPGQPMVQQDNVTDPANPTTVLLG